ncbi:MAG TPA: hypothetical protein VGJ29_09375 [Vicinamibacterales bacterium]
MKSPVIFAGADVAVARIVPTNCPVQSGCEGMPPAPTEIAYANVAAVAVALLTVPVSIPFNSTIPLGSETVTGPEAVLPL